MASRNTPSLLKRNLVFRNFLIATTVSLLGSNIFDIAMPLYVWERTHSAIALAMANVGLNLPYFLMAPLTGYSVDNFDKRRVMLTADVGAALCMATMLVYDLSGYDPIWPIILLVFFAKTFAITFETVTTFQLIPALVSPQDLAPANTWFLSSLRFIQVVGPITGGGLMSLFGVRACIFVNVISFGATLFFVYQMKGLSQLIDGDCPPRERRSIAKIGENFYDSIRFVMTSSVFRPFIPLMFLWNLSPLIPGTPSLTYYFTAVQGFSPAEYGFVVSLVGVFGIIGYLAASFAYERFDFTRTFVGSSIWQAAVGTLSLVFLPFPGALATVFAISRTGSSVLNMGTFLIRQTRVPKTRMGGINSSLRMFFMSAAPISAVMQGALIETFGVGVSLAVGALCLWGVVYYARILSTAFSQPQANAEKAA